MTYKVQLNISNHGPNTKLVDMSGSQIGVFYPSQTILQRHQQMLNLKFFNFLNCKKEKLEKKISVVRKVGVNDDLTQYHVFRSPNGKFLNVVTVFNPTIESNYQRKGFDFMINFFGLPQLD